MAKLTSEDDQVKTSFELIFLNDEIKNKPAISWVPYKIVLTSAGKELIFEKQNNNKGAGDYVLALKPIDEVENVIGGIKSFLESQISKMFSFEPVEPSFELILEKSHKGYSVTCWVDGGNVVSDHFSWDGFGLRFFTTKDKILSFVDELNKERGDLFLKENA